MSATFEKIRVQEASETSDKEVADCREKMGTLLMPRYFEKNEPRIKANFIGELRKIAGADIHRATTWSQIEEIIEELIENLFIEIRKKEPLPEKAIDLKLISLETAKDNQDDIRKKMAAMLGFPSFEMMMKCVELGKNLEEDQA